MTESRTSQWIVMVVGVAVVLLVVALGKGSPGPVATPSEGAAPGGAAAPAPKLVEVIDPSGRIAVPLPVAATVKWEADGPRILTASGGGLEIEAFDSQGPPVRAIQLYELAVQNATGRGETVVRGDRSEAQLGAVEVALAIRTKDGRDGHVRYSLRGTRYLQVRAIGPGAGQVVSGLRLP